MSEGPLAGAGVLVTRAAHQSQELCAAVEAAGGRAIAFPVIDIVPRSPQDIGDDAATLGDADICVFVSRNAVEYGLAWSGNAALAAIGPATAEAIEAAARVVDIRPADGYDSEHLLAEPALNAVSGRNIRIIRGGDGREHLARTLRERGATVEYLAVYERRVAGHTAADLAALERRWQQGEINAVVVMSVQSLGNLLALLPDTTRKLLAGTLLVTPAARVIKEALERLPGTSAILAAGPLADDIVRAIAERGPQSTGRNS